MSLHEYQKKKIVLRGLLEGRGYFKAIKAMNFAEKIHGGSRKDGSPEFSHQVEMALHAWCFLPSLIHPEDTLVCIFFHDSIEDEKTTYEEIQAHFETRMADLAIGMSKIRRGMKMANEIYYEHLASDPVLSFAKGIDRAHNLGTMKKAFSDRKQLQYLTEARNFTLPMLKEARRTFPEQVAAYEGVKHAICLVCNLTEHFIQRISTTDAAETITT
jgi:(p)ppGpp synthase/HD superfamily hydrolase